MKLRRVSRTGSGSLYITLPKDAFRFHDRVKVEFEGHHLIIRRDPQGDRKVTRYWHGLAVYLPKGMLEPGTVLLETEVRDGYVRLVKLNV